MIAPNLKSGKCIIDEAAKKIVVYADKEFKAEILKEPKNLAVIEKHLEKFTGGGYFVEIELQKPEDENKEKRQNIIDDIIDSAALM
jgi:hypothetical protein